MDTKTVLAYGVFVADDRAEMSRQHLYQWLVEAALIDGAKSLDQLLSTVGKELTLGKPFPPAAIRSALESATAEGKISLSRGGLYSLSGERRSQLTEAEARYAAHRDCFYFHILAAVQESAGAVDQTLVEAIQQGLDLVLQSLFQAINLDQLQAIAREPAAVQSAIQTVGNPVDLAQFEASLSPHTTATKARLIRRGVETALEQLPADCVPYLVSSHLRTCYSYLLQVDPKLQCYTKELFCNRILLLDTNVLLALIFEKHENHSAVKEVIDLSHSLGCSLCVTNATVGEFNYLLGVSERFARSLLNGGDPFVRQLAQSGRAIILAQYASESPSLSWEQFAAPFRPLHSFLERLNIRVVDFDLELLHSHPEWGYVFSKILQAKEDRNKTSLDPRGIRLEAVEVDVSNFLATLKLREDKPVDEMGERVWFLTRDSSLLMAQRYMSRTFKQPTIQRIYDWGALLLSYKTPSLASADLAAFMKALIRSKLGILPDDDGIDVGLIKLLVDSKLYLKGLSKLPIEKARESLINMQRSPSLKPKLAELVSKDDEDDALVQKEILDILVKAIHDKDAADRQSKEKNRQLLELEEQINSLHRELALKNDIITSLNEKDASRDEQVAELVSQKEDTNRKLEGLSESVSKLQATIDWENRHPIRALISRMLGVRRKP